MTGRKLKDLEGGKCPMCGSKDISYRVHAQPPSRDIWHCQKCNYEWYHFYDTE
jgi:ribosomal protein L37AE/L43A